MDQTDKTGNRILEVIADAKSFNYWMYQTIHPLLYGNTLEIGSGIGNISSLFLASKSTITLSDTDEFYLQTLKEKFGSSQYLKEILLIDLQHPSFEITYASLKEQYDSVFLLNVLEHVEADTTAIKNCNFLLKQSGTILILTPAYSFLYSSLDKALGHYRRYTTNRLSTLLQKNNFITRKKIYFNTLGIVAWLYAKIFRLKTIPSGKMRFYNKIVPLARVIDKIVFRKIGLSAIITGEKK